MSRRRMLLVAAAAALLVACSGANSPSEVPSPSDTAMTTSPTPTEPAPSPTTASTDAEVSAEPSSVLGCPSSWDDGLHEDGLSTIDMNRYADICVGESFDDASAVPGVQQLVGEPMCPWVGPIVDAGDLYIAAISGVDDPGAEIDIFRAIWLGDMAAIEPGMPTTAEGIGIGSPVADVYTAYPDAFELVLDDPSRGERTEIVVPGPATLGYVFDAREGMVAEITWGVGMDDGVAGEFCAL